MTGTKYLILIRNPNTGAVFVARASTWGGNASAKLFDSKKEAEAEAVKIHPCRSWPYSIVEAP